MTRALTQPLPIGRIVGLFGVKGWVKVYSYTDPREAVLSYDTWLIDRKGDWHEVQLAEGKLQGKSVIARLEGVGDPDEASELIGCDLAIRRDQLPELPGDRYYWSDLEGLEVRRDDGSTLGKVAYVMETGANDVLVTKGDTERLIPFVMNEVILDVDLAEGVITVDWEWD